MKKETLLLLLKVIDGMAFAFQQIPALRQRYRKQMGIVRRLIEEDRDPTPEEWNAVSRLALDQTQTLRRAAAQQPDPPAEGGGNA